MRDVDPGAILAESAEFDRPEYAEFRHEQRFDADGLVERVSSISYVALLEGREREEFLAKVQREGDDMLNDARVQAERMVQRTEIVRDAQRAAQRTLETAHEEARRLRHEAEDYCDQKLAGFEIVLERTMKTVQAGREKLRVVPLEPASEGEVGAVDPETGEPFFDQDRA
jgi:hypothetical protein